MSKAPSLAGAFPVGAPFICRQLSKLNFLAALSFGKDTIVSIPHRSCLQCQGVFKFDHCLTWS